MTEPKWPTRDDAIAAFYDSGESPNDVLAHAIELCKVAFAEWRDNLLIGIQKPGPSGVQPPSFEQVQIDVLTDRITKLERRLKRVGKMSAKAWNLADEANKVAWAVDETTRPLTTEPPAVSHTRLADEIRGAATKAPVQPKVVNDDDPDADELPLIRCNAVNDREPRMMCHLGIGHVGDHHGQRDGYGRFWAADELPKAVLCGIASIRFPERLCGMAKGHHGPVHQDAEGNEWRRDSSFVPAADTQCRVIAMRFGITYNCQLTRGHDGQHDGTSGQLRHQWTSP